MATLHVNTDELIDYTIRLRKLPRAAFPSAVRNTLNQAAFEDKKQIPITAKENFITRSKTFFRVFTAVNKAQGFEVNRMKAATGLRVSAGSKIVKGLEKQEFGGSVNRGKLIAHDDARVGKSNKKLVRKQNYKEKIDFFDATPIYRAAKGKNKTKFRRAMYASMNSGKQHFLLKNGNKGIVYSMQGAKASIRTRKLNVKLKKVYMYDSNEMQRVKPTGFMYQASRIVSKKIPYFYTKQAKFQFNKALRK